ncbi:MAG: transposase [Campylobacterota bacterium]
MPRGGRVQRYSQEFKQTAIELAQAGDKSAMQVARELEMSEKTLYNWLRQYRSEHGEKKDQGADDAQSELRRLRRENAALKQERDILKKATAYFAKEAH